MGWFEKQIQQRSDLDQQLFEDSLLGVAGVVMGEKYVSRITDERIITGKAIDEVLKYYHYKPVEVPRSVKDPEEYIDYCLRPYGVMRRDVVLEDGWYKDAYGPMLAFRKEDSEPVTLLPGALRGYFFNDSKTGKKVRINRKTADLFKREAYCFYRPLPQRKIGISDLMLYMKSCLSPNDVPLIVLATLAMTLVGMLIPRITKALTGPVLTSGDESMLISIAICLFSATLSSQLIGAVKGMYMSRIQSKTSIGIQASMMMRVMSLPAEFFRKYSAGELTNRSMSVNSLCDMLLGTLMSTGLTSLMSLLYITQIISFAPALALPSLLIIFVTVLFSTISSLVQIRLTKQIMENDAKESGMSYSMITGIQKIKLAGAEKRVFARWADLYSKGMSYTYAPPAFIKINSVINLAINLASTIILYFLAAQNGIDQSAYYAFTAAYGSVMGAFSSLAGIALTAARIKPTLDMAKPFLEAEPETSDNREIVTRLSGGIELNNVYFRYSEKSPYIVNNMTLRIRPGEYVAIVGRTGCGKSTLMRLLLGFEKPEKGAIYYDGRDINSLDLGSLRRKIGTVMQSGGLFQGDIYSNIVITAPELTLDDAWAAAETAGIAEDIRNMPMGMQTMISEGQGGISGGQKQRIMIARAIAPKPKILMFDEATSALDNKTQKQVSEALDAMGCTRIVIAHRLSTIRHCDRILVLDKGNVTEDGTYDELIAKNGYFAELVARQRLDTAQEEN
ncbi:MAG TPA: NHLP bacteriocin export ABC transporter permease/ATPase subunit [Ruminococcaceae bacterium]|nr:NHLP bacteriocin export ABC transporter permease/ATPase subunit [Oscillospiraceae bacterium]